VKLTVEQSRAGLDSHGFYLTEADNEKFILERIAISPYVPPSEEIPMTFQMGLVGTDGVVIASDTKATRWGQIRTSSTTRKIFWNEETGIACAVAGDDITAKIADEVCQLGITEIGDHMVVYELLQNAVTCSWERNTLAEQKRADQDSDSRLIIALTKNPHHLWWIDANHRRSATGTYQDKIYAGDRQNASIYFLERFYNHPKLLPLDQLVFLASHAVCEAGELNRTGVGGLDVLTWRFEDREPKIYSESETAELARRSAELVESIRSRIFP
jgi:hypothetical protein